jgi:hypothetical protein
MEKSINHTNITLYKDDYTEYSWRDLCRTFGINNVRITAITVVVDRGHIETYPKEESHG